MTRRVLRVLYVEDEPIQQQLLAHALGKIPGFHCQTDFETTEEGGLTAFQRSPYDAVFVDYQLAGGNGLSLIRRIRMLDSVVPVIAVSGVAPAEVAAELVVSGADDYLDKSRMDTTALAHSLRIAVLRADGLRKRMSRPADADLWAELTSLSHWIAAANPAALLAHLDRCEAAARSVVSQPVGLVDWFEAATANPAVGGLDVDAARLALRPFLLDLVARLDDVRPESPSPRDTTGIT